MPRNQQLRLYPPGKNVSFYLQASLNFCNKRVEPTKKNTINTHRQNIKKYMKIIEEKKGSPIFHKRQINSNNSNCPTCAQFYEKSNHISPFQLKLQISIFSQYHMTSKSPDSTTTTTSKCGHFQKFKFTTFPLVFFLQKNFRAFRNTASTIFRSTQLQNIDIFNISIPPHNHIIQI